MARNPIKPHISNISSPLRDRQKKKSSDIVWSQKNETRFWNPADPYYIPLSLFPQITQEEAVKIYLNMLQLPAIDAILYNAQVSSSSREMVRRESSFNSVWFF